MARKKKISPEEYRESIDGDLSDMLERLRTIILESLPEEKEFVRNKMLYYPSVGYLGAKGDHVALYMAPSLVDEHDEKLDDEVEIDRAAVRFDEMSQIKDSDIHELIQASRHRTVGL